MVLISPWCNSWLSKMCRGYTVSKFNSSFSRLSAYCHRWSDYNTSSNTNAFLSSLQSGFWSEQLCSILLNVLFMSHTLCSFYEVSFSLKILWPCRQVSQFFKYKIFYLQKSQQYSWLIQCYQFNSIYYDFQLVTFSINSDFLYQISVLVNVKHKE